VKFLGTETVNGIEAEKLELIPKSAHLKKQYRAHFALDRPGTGSFGAAAVL